MAKKMKAPLLPGKEKILTKPQIQELEKKNITVVDQVAKDT